MRHNIDSAVKIQASITQKFYLAVGSPHIGAAIDTKDLGDILIQYNAGTHVTSATVDIKIQESDDGSTFTDVVGAVFSQVTTANHETTYLASIRPTTTKRYIRAHATVATADANLGVFVLGNALQPPASQGFASSFTIT